MLSLFPEESDLDRAFREFHAANPAVYAELRAMAFEAVARGRKRIGIKMIWEALRWSHFLCTTDESYAFNNNLTSRYARLLMDREPELRGVFEVRELKTRGVH